MVNTDDGRPLFRQIAEEIENSIVDGALAEDTQAPSTNELAVFHRINPATAAKGLNQLVVDGVLYKKRGMGMFVVPGAREQLIKRRRKAFGEQFLRPLLAEAEKLGITDGELIDMIEKGTR
ncbi:GntR family transcriptional regulator [Millisia brevis]|uniref:GntR family transcriptional regulator n=1 Tax=Millisia brevis TaxID=264148 RepID=UPI0008320234|nr:GntR family transcriptional regulator [Millisia brevis]